MLQTEIQPPSSERAEWLDYVRFLAAVGVMIYHYTSNGYPDQATAAVTYFPVITDIFAYGYLGVDLFFIVSGYVVVRSALGRSAGSFAVSRILRLYPAFVFCLCLTSLFLVLSGSSIELSQFAANLTMMPMRFQQPFVDGVYWSLTYEIFFYGCVFVLLCTGLLRRLDRIVLIWSLVALLSFAVGAKPFFFSGYFTLFAGGCALYLVGTTWRPTALVSLLVCAALSVVEAFERHPASSTSSAALAALIVGGFFFSFLGLQHSPLARLKLPASSILGAMSYPIYLLHFELGIMALNHLVTPRNHTAALVMVMAGIVLAALGVVIVVERPVRALLSPFAARYISTPINLVVAKSAAIVKRSQKATASD